MAEEFRKDRKSDLEEFSKKDVLKYSQNSQAEASNFIKNEALTQVFCREFYEIFNNTFFHRTPPVAASEQ